MPDEEKEIDGVMELSRKFLESLDIDEETIKKIIAAHRETVDALKEQCDDMKEKADGYDKLKSDIEALKGPDGKSYKELYEAEKQAFAAFKSTQAQKDAREAKAKAVRAYFESKNITGGNLDIALKGCVEEIDAVELENGKIKDSTALDSLIGGIYAGLVSKEQKKGAGVPTPPIGGSGGEQQKEHRASKIAKEYYASMYGAAPEPDKAKQ